MNYESQEHYEAEMGYAGQAEAEAIAQLEEQHPIIEVNTNELSKVNWEEKMTTPDEFIIRKTQPKKGLPIGAYVCFNHHLNPRLQTFGNTPIDALKNYLEPKKKEEISQDTINQLSAAEISLLKDKGFLKVI